MVLHSHRHVNFIKVKVKYGLKLKYNSFLVYSLYELRCIYFF